MQLHVLAMRAFDGGCEQRRVNAGAGDEQNGRSSFDRAKLWLPASSGGHDSPGAA
jgi:hypothetical protein